MIRGTSLAILALLAVVVLATGVCVRCPAAAEPWSTPR